MHTDTVLSSFVYNLKFKDANVFVAFSRGADTFVASNSLYAPELENFPRSELLIAQFTKKRVRVQILSC